MTNRIICTLIIALYLSSVYAQMDLPSAGGNPRAKITEEVGITDITLTYSRPDLAGREGKIFGTLVPYGFATQSFITNKLTSPWRAGANDNTTISFEHDVKVEGSMLKAGTYGLSMAVWPDSVTVIFSKSIDAWGSFNYEEKNDALRVSVKPIVSDKNVEWLKYEFIEHKEKYCTVALLWEKWIIPFKIEVDVENIVLARLRSQMTGQKGFNISNVLQAAQYCLNKNINLDEALVWSQRAVTGNQGQKSYITLRNLGVAFERLNKYAQADSVMTEALSLATANQYLAYARQLIAQKRTERALTILQESEKKYGDVYAVHNGYMYAYSAKMEYPKAILSAEKAKSKAPNDQTKTTIDGFITKLKENKDIN